MSRSASAARPWTSACAETDLFDALGETEQELTDLLAGEGGADVEARGQRGPARKRLAVSPAPRRRDQRPGGPRLQMPPTSTERPCPDRFARHWSSWRGAVGTVSRAGRMSGMTRFSTGPSCNRVQTATTAADSGLTVGELIERFEADRAPRHRVQ